MLIAIGSSIFSKFSSFFLFSSIFSSFICAVFAGLALLSSSVGFLLFPDVPAASIFPFFTGGGDSERFLLGSAPFFGVSFFFFISDFLGGGEGDLDLDFDFFLFVDACDFFTGVVVSLFFLGDSVAFFFGVSACFGGGDFRLLPRGFGDSNSFSLSDSSSFAAFPFLWGDLDFFGVDFVLSRTGESDFFFVIGFFAFFGFSISSSSVSCSSSSISSSLIFALDRLVAGFPLVDDLVVAFVVLCDFFGLPIFQTLPLFFKFIFFYSISDKFSKATDALIVCLKMKKLLISC